MPTVGFVSRLASRPDAYDVPAGAERVAALADIGVVRAARTGFQPLRDRIADLEAQLKALQASTS
jgi:hypothetical protein